MAASPNTPTCDNCLMAGEMDPASLWPGSASASIKGRRLACGHYCCSTCIQAQTVSGRSKCPQCGGAMDREAELAGSITSVATVKSGTDADDAGMLHQLLGHKKAYSSLTQMQTTSLDTRLGFGTATANANSAKARGDDFNSLSLFGFPVLKSAQATDDIFLSDDEEADAGSGGLFNETARALKESEDQLHEINALLSEDKQRLTKIVQACDRLKHETVKKISQQPVMQMNQYKQMISALKDDMSKCKQFKDDGGNGAFRKQVCDRAHLLNKNIGDALFNEKSKKRVLEKLRNSSITVRFQQTSLENAKDEISLDFAKEDQFPGNVYITCCTLQDIFTECVSLTSESFGADALKSKSQPPVQSSVSLAASNEGAASFMASGRRAADDVPRPTSSAATSAPASRPATTPMAWSEVSKINCPPQQPAKPTASAVARSGAFLPRMEKTVAETNRPHCFLDIRISKQKTVRIVISTRPDFAPKMSENFINLCMGTRGYGYKGCKFFRCKPDDHVVCGDFEHNNGSGGYSAMKDRLFLAEQCPLKDHKGAVRMRGIERTAEGRCRVGSQFMAWVGDIEYKEYKYTLVFGEVTQGLQHLQEISRIGMMYSSSDQWLLKEEVIVTNCGLL